MRNIEVAYRMNKTSEISVKHFEMYLFSMEKSKATIEKYSRDVKRFLEYLGDQNMEKDIVIGFKQYLVNSNYSTRSINSMLASVNSFLDFYGRKDCRVKFLKYQKQTYMVEDKELTKADYMNLLAAAENIQLKLIIQTICATGIGVSELKYITVKAVRKGEAIISCKGKNRVIFIPTKLKKYLLAFIKDSRIKDGPVFVSKKGAPLDRSYIWRKMKELCVKAKVPKEKVFPHNLRKLFARTFYKEEKDISKLADVLGHSNIETTRIYIMTTSNEHRKKLID